MVKPNETTVVLLDNRTLNMSCSLYGLTVTVKVVDYFGQGIANMEVTLQRLGQMQATTSTGPDGTATFYNVVGGLLNILVISNGASTPIAAQSVNIENPTTLISIHVDEYVVLAGMLVQTGQLAAIVLMVLIVVLILSLEVYRRRRHRVQKAETSSADKES
jgi:ABC-type amino acid transport system permease subunit